MHNYHPLLNGYADFLDRLFAHLDEAGIRQEEFRGPDHLGYRVETLERYHELKALLSESETLVSEAQVNGRPIAVFKLSQPVPYRDQRIAALELPAPSTVLYPEGLEHAEFVVPDLQAFMEKHSSLTFITKDIGKKINPEIAVAFPGCAAKFHLLDLLDAIVLQEQAGTL